MFGLLIDLLSNIFIVTVVGPGQLKVIKQLTRSTGSPILLISDLVINLSFFHLIDILRLGGIMRNKNKIITNSIKANTKAAEIEIEMQCQ